MTITSVTSAAFTNPANASDTTSSDVTTADQRFAELLAAGDDAKNTLAEITHTGAKGYWAWKMREMRKEIAQEVMGEINLTPEKIAQMSAKDRLATENKIEQIVEQRLRLAIAEEMKRRQHSTQAANASLQSIIDTAQQITQPPAA